MENNFISEKVVKCTFVQAMQNLNNKRSMNFLLRDNNKAIKQISIDFHSDEEFKIFAKTVLVQLIKITE